jgi:hypothetical protein
VDSILRQATEVNRFIIDISSQTMQTTGTAPAATSGATPVSAGRPYGAEEILPPADLVSAFRAVFRGISLPACNA